jgi:membrane protease YdiL (CAAX protease family)
MIDLRNGARELQLYRISQQHPFIVPISLLLIAFVFRIIDIFVLGLDELLGEIILSKLLGFLLVLGYIWAVGKTITSIGLHRRDINEVLLIGGVGTSVIFVAAFGLQYVALGGTDQSPGIVFVAIDPKTGLEGGVLFTMFLLLGNVVNSFMEEGLFRGVMLPHFMRSLSFRWANLLQAALFGLWHAVWPVKSLITGDLTMGAAVTEAVSLVLTTTVAGLVFGYLFYKTGSLWAPWLAHTIHNSALNLVHIRTVDGLDADMGVLIPVLVVGYVLLVGWTMLLTRYFDLAPLEPWGIEPGN